MYHCGGPLADAPITDYFSITSDATATKEPQLNDEKSLRIATSDPYADYGRRMAIHGQKAKRPGSLPADATEC
jgi:hypothetical protein